MRTQGGKQRLERCSRKPGGAGAAAASGLRGRQGPPCASGRSAALLTQTPAPACENPLLWG